MFWRIKLYFLLIFWGYGCTGPFMTLFFKSSLLLTPIQVGILSAVGPIMTFILTPYWTLLADKNNNHRFILSLNAILSGVVGLAFVALQSLSKADPARDQLGSRTFLTTLAMNILFSSFMAPINAMLDVIILNFLNTYKQSEEARKSSANLDVSSLYGRQRSVGSFAYGSMAFLLGSLIESPSDSKNASDMSILFYGFALLMLLSVLALYWPQATNEWKPSSVPQIKSDRESAAAAEVQKTVEANTGAQTAPSEESAASLSFKDSFLKLLNHQSAAGSILLFWFFVLTMGFCLTIVNNYFFLMLVDDLAAPSVLLGVISIARISLEIPFFFWSGEITKTTLRLTSSVTGFKSTSTDSPVCLRWMMIFSAVLLCIRLAFFTLMSFFKWNPWIAVAIELSHGPIYAMVYSAAIQLAAQSAPKCLQATSQGIFNAIFCGFGPCIGSLLGGVLYQCVGATALFGLTFLLMLGGLLIYLRDVRVATGGYQELEGV